MDPSTGIFRLTYRPDRAKAAKRTRSDVAQVGTPHVGKCSGVVQRWPDWAQLVKQFHAEQPSSEALTIKDPAFVPGWTAWNQGSHRMRTALRSEVERKLRHYDAQDARAHRVYEMNITLADGRSWGAQQSAGALDWASFLSLRRDRCTHCDRPLVFAHEDRFDPHQWTLDRLNNQLPHNEENVVMACLECNLKRGDSKSYRPLFTIEKQ